MVKSGAVPIQVVLAEDSVLVRDVLTQILEGSPDVELVAIADDQPTLLAAIEETRPDVVVTDIRMPPGNSDEGLQAADRLRTTHPDVGVVVLSQYATPSYALALLEGGLSGYAVKSAGGA